MMARAIVALSDNQVPTAITVMDARCEAMMDRIARANAGSPAPWNVSAISGRKRSPRRISVAGPPATGRDDDGPVNGAALRVGATVRSGLLDAGDVVACDVAAPEGLAGADVCAPSLRREALPQLASRPATAIPSSRRRVRIGGTTSRIGH